MREDIKLALRALNGSCGKVEFDEGMCECDPDVGACPCQYCAIYAALVGMDRELEEAKQIAEPTDKMIEAGNTMASDLTDASIMNEMKGLGGSSQSIEEYLGTVDNVDIIYKYLLNEIDSVTAIYIAMQRARS